MRSPVHEVYTLGAPGGLGTRARLTLRLRSQIAMGPRSELGVRTADKFVLKMIREWASAEARATRATATGATRAERLGRTFGGTSSRKTPA